MVFLSSLGRRCQTIMHGYLGLSAVKPESNDSDLFISKPFVDHFETMYTGPCNSCLMQRCHETAQESEVSLGPTAYHLDCLKRLLLSLLQQ